MRTIRNFIIFLLITGAVTAQAQDRLKEFSRASDARWRAERSSAESLATAKHLPIRSEQANGRVIELQRFENGMPRYYATENLNAARTISTDKVWPTGGLGYFLTGSGITLGEWDAGKVRTTHQEFGGRVISTEGSLVDHSTHVAGTMVAAGVNPNAKGMSYAGNLNAYDWNNDVAEMSTQAGLGLRVSNHSYGFITGWDFNYFNDGKWAWFGDPTISTVEDYRFGFYDQAAADYDAVAKNAPYYLIVKAAGNDRNEGPDSGATIQHWVFAGGSWVKQTVSRNQDGNSGYDCLEGAGVSKNVLTVGAVDDLPAGYATPAGVSMSNFSSWGHTDDGRIKPDIVANGVALTSTLSGADNLYGVFSGTSMATPNASGSVGLLLDYYNSLHGNTLILSSTMKGLIIQTADEAGTSAGPDYRFGWGLMNTLKAAQLMTSDSADGFGSHIREILMHNHDTLRILVGCDGIVPLKATLCWTDPSGTVSAASLDPTDLKLVNDFDLRIIKRVDLSTSYPWVLNPASPASAATTGDNIRDNVEQVLISSPASGNYIVQITHKGSLASPQNVSLIVSGNRTPLGSAIAIAPDSIHVAIAPGGTRHDSLLISNSSDSTLIYHVACSPASAWLSSSIADSGRVPPSSSAYYTYDINAAILPQWSAFNGSLTFTSNAAANPVLGIAIDLSTTGPKIAPKPPTVVVDVDSGSIGAGTLFVVNAGTTLLKFSASDTGVSLPSWLKLSSDTGSVLPGDTSAVLLSAGDTLLPIGDYATELAVASNDSLDGTRFVNVELHVGTRHLFMTDVVSQWNLVSLPLQTLSSLKHVLYPTATSAAFVYQGNYAASESLRLGEGFWMKFGAPQMISLDGYTVNPETLDVRSGWNIVGSMSVPSAITSISSIPGGIVTSKFYGYAGSYYSADTIEPGKGYWVKSDQTGKLLLSASPSIAPSAAIRIIPTNERPPAPPEGGEQGKIQLPKSYALEQNFPNPFNPTTVINYQLLEQSYVTLKIYNVLGIEVATLVDRAQDAGFVTVEWNGRSTNGLSTELPSGVYFYKLTAGDFTATKKMMLLR